MKNNSTLELILLAAIWGASFLFMRIGSPEFGAVLFMALRTLIASLFLLPLMFLYKQQSLFRLALPEKRGYIPKLEDKILGPKEKTKSKPKTIIDFIDKKDEKEDKK